MNLAPLLIEIFIQELPFSGIKKEINNVLTKFNSLLESYGLKAEVEFFYTPNRLILYCSNFPIKQEDSIEEFIGPPLSIAYNENELAPAGISFINKLNISKNDLEIESKNGKECIAYKRKKIGILSCNLLEDIVIKWLASLDFGRSMRWGSGESIFIRPISNITILLGDERISISKLAEIYQISKSNKIYPHRAFEGKDINHANDYFPFLNANYVIYDGEKRSEKIIEEIKEIEEKHKIKVELDSNLLFEVVSITEYPTAIYGEFDEKFLCLPNEVIITSMKINQKYFCVHKNGKLHNGFVFVCNAVDKSFFSQILKGNMKVLKARLEDALFFYESDKKSFNENTIDNGLKNIEFIAGLGSIFDKVQREINLFNILVENIHIDFDKTHVIKAIELSKNDLLTSMVNEFGELQGIMGSYYVTNSSSFTRLCLREQNLPENDLLPSTLASALLAIVGKLDSILGLFSINKIPNGSRDPFALRRAANGIIKIISCFKIRFNLFEIIEKSNYKNLDSNIVFSFFLERLEGALEVNPSLINAAIKSNQKDLSKLCMQIDALNKVLKNEDSSTLKILFKRLANILGDFQSKQIDINLLIESYEIALFNELKSFQNLNIEDPLTRLEKLLDFKNVLMDFFDNVLINVEDVKIKENRKALVKSIYDEFLKVGDVKEIFHIKSK